MTTATTTPPQKGGWFKRANKKLLFGVLAIIVAIGVLVGTSLRGTLSYYVTVDELKAKGAEAYGDRVRVGGRVQEGTIKEDQSTGTLSFIMFHNDASNSISVEQKSLYKPDLFQDNANVIVEGKWQPTGIFHATKILTQHPPEFQMVGPGQQHEDIERK